MKYGHSIAGFLFLLLPLGGSDNIYAIFQDDTLAYYTVKGQVVDAGNNRPIIFANVYLEGTNIGTVSNADGDFILKIPLFIENKTLVISSIGYKNTQLLFDRMVSESNFIKLEPNPIPIEEVTIINKDARELLSEALRRIPRNYSNEPVMVTAFYRETIKQNRNYVAVSEAILDGYKASYTNIAETDRIKIFKGRKSTDVQKMDTVALKLQGGPQTTFMLDVVKNPLDLFDQESLSYYTYQMGGIVNIDDRQAYVIEFNQLQHIDFPLYSGKIYIDVTDLAIAGTEFRISPQKLDQATPYLIRKKPIGMRIDIVSANYLASYRFNAGNWNLYHTRTELILTTRWQKKLFKSTFTAMSEMAITDVDPQDVTKFKYRETTRRSDIFIEQVKDFEDPDFWGEYNIIQPEESIQTAIEKIGRKLKRRDR